MVSTRDATAPPKDASPPIDSSPPGVDATVTDAGGGSFCASLTTAVKLCTDFDEGQPVGTGWQATDTYGGFTIGIATDASFSPPGSFLSTINPSGAPSSARLLQVVPNDSPTVHVDLQILLTPQTGTLELAVIHQVTPDGLTYGLYYREVDSALQVELRSLDEAGTLLDKTWPIANFPSGWTEVVMDLVVADADAGTFTVKQGGSVVVSESNIQTSTPSRTQMFVEVGFYSNDPESAQANFDNTIVDWPDAATP